MVGHLLQLGQWQGTPHGVAAGGGLARPRSWPSTRLLWATLFVAFLALGCQPQAIVYVPPVGISHTPDLNGAVEVVCSAGRASAAVIAYRKPYYYAVTAKHVISASTWLKVDGQLAKTFITSFSRDVAIIRFKSYRTYTVYPLARAELGQECWIVGWPWPGRIVNRGWISRVAGSTIWHNAGGAMGCSGGPILSAKGELLGIVAAFMVEVDDWVIPSRQMYDTLGYAVSAQEIAWLMNTIPSPK